jgi:hypothetical protein
VRRASASSPSNAARLSTYARLSSMAGPHWGERDRKSSPVENALIGIFSTIAALGFYGGLVLAAVALLRAETCTVTSVSDGDTTTVKRAARCTYE